MRYRDCSRCDSSHLPQNETVTLNGEVYCSKCYQEVYSDKVLSQGMVAYTDLDPTVCATCGTDAGSMILSENFGRPICDDCAKKLKDKIMPLWVKAFFAAIIAIVVFSFFYNWRFYQSYSNIKKANAAFAKGDYEKAVVYAKDASDEVPELEELKGFKSFYNGVFLLTKDKSAEALEELTNSKRVLQDNIAVDNLINKAKMGIGFDSKNYEQFLSAAREYVELDTTNAQAYLSVASAYSCIYVDKGQDSAKNYAYEYVQKALSLDSTDKDIKEYANLVDYRISNKIIIKHDDFIKQFPNGWTKK
jgi:tetratricopeptide (TPR) repeat protein